MNTLLAKSQFRFALRHPVGTVAALVGVAVAVAAVVAVHLLGQSLRLGLETASDTAFGDYTHLVTRAGGLGEADYFRLRQRWRAGEPALAGVQAMMPVLDDYVVVNDASEGDQSVYRLIGIEPLAAGDALDALPLATEPRIDGNAARFLVDDVVFATSDAAAAIDAAGGRINGQPVTVAATAATDALLADLPTAQRLLGREGELDAVWIRVDGARSRLLAWFDAVLPGIAAATPDAAAPALDGYTVVAENQWNPLRRFADASIFNLGMLAMLSVLMAAFLTTQASFANAARRRDEWQRLWALGVAGARLRTIAAGEGLLLGSVGAGLGIALGSIAADFLLRQTSAPAEPTFPTPVLDAWVIGKALFCGGAVASIGPLLIGRGSGRRPWATRLAAIAAALLVALGLAVGNSLTGIFAALLAACGVQILAVVPLLGSGARALTTRYGFASLATRSSLRDAAARIGEIKLALGALSVATAAAIGMGLMVASLQQDFSAMLEQRLWRGIHVSAATDADFDIDWIRAQPGVQDVRRYGEFNASVPQGRLRVDVAVLDARESARYGFAGALTTGAMLNEVGARLFGLGVGDVLAVRAGGKRVDVQVAHVFRDFGAPAPRLLLPEAMLAPFADLVAWRQLWVLTDDSAMERLSAALRHRYPASRVVDQTQMRNAAMTIFERTFAVSRGLTAVALAVAAIGLYAALTALLAARRHEFRLWSAVGFSGREIWRQAMTQTLLLGVVAVAAALPFGVFIAWVLCAFVNPLAFGWSIGLRLDPTALSYPLLLGLGVALAAGATPAYRLARTANDGR